jgi:hypothetical protein
MEAAPDATINADTALALKSFEVIVTFVTLL